MKYKKVKYFHRAGEVGEKYINISKRQMSNIPKPLLVENSLRQALAGSSMMPELRSLEVNGE